MANTPKENFWESIFQPDVIQYLYQLLQQQQQATQAMSQIAGQLQAVAGELAAVTTAQQAAQETGASSGRLAMPLPTLSLPVSPKTINEMILSVELSGHLFIDIGNLAFTCPAMQTTTASLPVFPNTVIVYGSPLRYVASYYSSGITLSLSVDGKQVVGVGGHPYLLTSSGQAELGQYFYSRQGIEFSIVNNTNTDTTISVFGEAIYIDREFFDLFFAPLMSYGYNVLKSLAAIVNGGHEIS